MRIVWGSHHLSQRYTHPTTKKAVMGWWDLYQYKRGSEEHIILRFEFLAWHRDTWDIIKATTEPSLLNQVLAHERARLIATIRGC